VAPDRFVARWVTDTGRPVEWIEGRRADELAESWLARAAENVRRQAEDLPPARDAAATEFAEADTEAAPRVRILWSDPRGIHCAATLHKAAWKSAELWALDCWLATSFIKRFLVADEHATTKAVGTADG
jgi:hypothetical protein